MGKIRAVNLGDEDAEEEQKRRADARRQTKMSKKSKVEGIGMHGGERTAVVSGTDIKPEFKKLIEKVEADEKNETSETDGKKEKKGKKKEVVVHKHSKKYLEAFKLVDKNKAYPLTDAVKLVKETSICKFDGTVELHINLNALALGDRKDFRGSVSLPHGTGKKVNVVVADDKVIADITAGRIEFDVLIAHPSMMPKLAKVARVLGPKGLMPNPKNGTVTVDIEKRIKELTAGQVNFKTEPENPIVHLSVGKISFTEEQLNGNIQAVILAIGKGKIGKLTLTSTMGPGIKIGL
jgi:large subunit ribosomal protein L1